MKSSAAALKLRESREIQGDVLAGFRKDQMTLLFLKFQDEAKARRWLKGLTPQISTTRQVAAFNKSFSDARRHSGGDDPGAMNATWINVSFTYAGLKFLMGGKEPIPGNTAPGTVRAFKEGAAYRAGINGDTGDNSPEDWLFGNSVGEEVHAVLTVAADRPQDLRAALTNQREDAVRNKVLIIFQQDAATLPASRRGHEHFGFKDGVSEPAVRGFDEADPAHPDYEHGKPGTRIIPAGEFVIGEERASDHLSAVPEWALNGSFQVVRRLAQDVPGWWAQVTEQLEVLKEQKAVDRGTTAEWLAARMVGRWRSGTPVAKCPDAENFSDPDAATDNDLSFKDDPHGLLTPLFSHIRKCNPRDGLVDGGELVDEKFMDRRRMIRRGAPYGQPFDPAGGQGCGPDAPRGLLFISYQADLVTQFEFCQQAWVNDPDFPHGRGNPDDPDSDRTPGRDPMIGLESEIAFEGESGTTKVTFGQFVRTEGGVYTVVPSMTTLRKLSGGRLPDNLVVCAPTVFKAGDTVDSGPARLVMEKDGNLVVRGRGGKVRWSTNTPGKGNQAVFQADGNLVIKDKKGKTVWQSDTGGRKGARLVVQTDGNVAIYPNGNSNGKPVWHTDTAV
ncbi:Dyp-type peroxidase [Streptomyces sp. NPDC054933]